MVDPQRPIGSSSYGLNIARGRSYVAGDAPGGNAGVRHAAYSKIGKPILRRRIPLE